MFPVDLSDRSFRHAVTASGQHLVFVEPVGPRAAPPPAVVVNWTSSLPH